MTATGAAVATSRVDATRVVTGLTWLIAAMAAVTSAVGLFWRTGGEVSTFTTVRGEVVELYGRGIYRYDTLFAAGGAQGNDAVVLLLGIPLLLGSTVLAGRGSARCRLLHTGVLVFFLYVYASAALGTVAFNQLFPLYVALFAASLFAVVLSFRSIQGVPLPPALPHRGLAVFLFISGAITLVVWGLPMLAAIATGGVTERLDSYSTDVTLALDLAAITPLTFVAGALVWRRIAIGYALAVSLLVLETMLAPLIAAQTIGQVAAGVTLETGEIVGPVAGFVVLAVAAGWFTVGIARRFPGYVPEDTAP